jgi:hypothetical protein
VHLNGDCALRLHKCSQGCGVEMLIEEMDYHREYQCVLRDKFFAVHVVCPMGCGASIQRRDVLEHVSYHCR